MIANHKMRRAQTWNATGRERRHRLGCPYSSEHLNRPQPCVSEMPRMMHWPWPSTNSFKCSCGLDRLGKKSHSVRCWLLMALFEGGIMSPCNIAIGLRTATASKKQFSSLDNEDCQGDGRLRHVVSPKSGPDENYR
jgi:hypothetical protein